MRKDKGNSRTKAKQLRDAREKAKQRSKERQSARRTLDISNAITTLVDTVTSSEDKNFHFEQYVQQQIENTLDQEVLNSSPKRPREETATNCSTRNMDLDWDLVDQRHEELRNRGSKQYDVPVS